MTSSGMRRWELARWLMAQNRSLLPPLAVAAFARIVGQLLAISVLLASAAHLMRLADGDRVPLAPWAVVIVGLCIAKAGFRYLEHYAGHWVAFAALQHLRELFFARLIPQAPAATRGRASAELTERAIRDIDRIEVFFAHTIPPAIASAIVPVIALGWAATRIALLPMGIVALTVLVALSAPFLSARMTWTASRRELAARGDLARHVADDMQGIREVLAFDAHSQRMAGLAGHHEALAAARRLAGVAGAVRDGLQDIVWASGLIAVLLLSGSVEDATMAVALLVGLRASGAGTMEFAASLDASFAAAARIRAVMDAPIRVADSGRGSLPGREAPTIGFDGVTLTYAPDARPALVDVTVTFPAGGWHYIAGVSGSGKSTLTSLLVRERDPDTGCIRIDGVPIKEVPLDELRAAVVVVDQRPVLFPGTIAENLRLGAPDATEADLRRALATVRLDGQSLIGGLHASVGERGTTLSGGQLQRIAIARALLVAPRILVLDEALSQLDAETARIVRDRITTQCTRMTVIEISHRVDVIPDDAWTVVIDQGRILHSGLAGLMRADGGPLCRLAARQ